VELGPPVVNGAELTDGSRPGVVKAVEMFVEEEVGANPDPLHVEHLGRLEGAPLAPID
jgi:hypothetical protein